ncbi:MAG: hypothetical protein U0229_08725 [Anaeromyxobacter sp.]
MDFTQEVLRYRECAKHVWNVYFQPMRDGWHEFFPVEKALLDALILSQFERRPGLWERHPDGYLDALVVVPTRAPGGLPAMFARQVGEKTNQWAETRLDDTVEMKFIEFFDWANCNDPREFQWVRARVLGPTGHELQGADVIVEYENVRFEAVT